MVWRGFDFFSVVPNNNKNRIRTEHTYRDDINNINTFCFSGHSWLVEHFIAKKIISIITHKLPLDYYYSFTAARICMCVCVCLCPPIYGSMCMRTSHFVSYWCLCVVYDFFFFSLKHFSFNISFFLSFYSIV